MLYPTRDLNSDCKDLSPLPLPIWASGANCMEGETNSQNPDSKSGAFAIFATSTLLRVRTYSTRIKISSVAITLQGIFS